MQSLLQIRRAAEGPRTGGIKAAQGAFTDTDKEDNMDSPSIAAYYKEIDPMKRKELLDKSIAEGEDPELNPIREELWELRYRNKSRNDKV